MGSLEGAVVVVTGSARGIGRAIAEELGHEGAKVVVNYSKSKEAAEDLVAKLQQGGSSESVAIQADVSDPVQAARLIEETVKKVGRIDVLVNAIRHGFIETEMWEGVPDKVKDEALAGIPLGRFGTPTEVARAVRSLIGDGGSLPGAALTNNGGAFMK